ncbi:MAG: hypothetical protein V4467_03945 [Patescibacteria group bacterium]
MSPNPYEYQPSVERSDQFFNFYKSLVEATSSNNGLSNEELAVRLEKLRSEKSLIVDALPGLNAPRAMSIIDRFLSAEENASDEQDMSGFVTLGLELFEQLRPQIEMALKRHDIDELRVLISYSHVAEHGHDNQPYMAIAGLMDHMESIEKKVMGPENFDRYQYFVQLILERGDVSQRSVARDLLIKSAEANIDNQKFSGLVSRFYAGFNNEEIGMEIIQKFLVRHKLPFTEVYSAWGESGNYKKRKHATEEDGGMLFSTVIYRNLDVIREVEAKNPGTCRFLYDEFNIADFGRYPAELLLDQRREFDSQKNPYGVIIYPRNDHNGAFYQDALTIKAFYADLKGEFSLRVAECEGKIDVVRALQKFDGLYNPTDGSGHKISLLILGGHGTENSIQFGGGGKKHTLYTEDLSRKVSTKAGGYLDENPTIILDSCSTGADKGIGQELSRKFGAKVVAPKTPTGLRSLHASQSSGGSFRFNAQYSTKTKSVFKHGEPVLTHGENQITTQ